MNESAVGNHWKLHHVGIPVMDLDGSLEAYASLPGASFGTEFRIDSSKAGEYLVYGAVPEPAVITRGAMGSVGPLGVELLQPVQGATVHRELLESAGEGIGHIAYTVADLEAEVAEMEARGFPVILSITPAGQSARSAAYLDTRAAFSGLIIELMQAR